MQLLMVSSKHLKKAKNPLRNVSWRTLTYWKRGAWYNNQKNYYKKFLYQRRILTFKFFSVRDSSNLPRTHEERFPTQKSIRYINLFFIHYWYFYFVNSPKQLTPTEGSVKGPTAEPFKRSPYSEGICFVMCFGRLETFLQFEPCVNWGIVRCHNCVKCF